MSSRQPRAYLAAPLFNSRERDFNEALEQRLSSMVDVFLPQRDGAMLTKLVANGVQVDAGRQVVFSRDTKALEECDLLVAILDGRTVDEGVAFELGYANALRKPCIGFKSDDRTMLPTGDNPMIVCACQSICSTIDDLLQVVAAAVAALPSDRSSPLPRIALDRGILENG